MAVSSANTENLPDMSMYDKSSIYNKNEPDQEQNSEAPHNLYF